MRRKRQFVAVLMLAAATAIALVMAASGTAGGRHSATSGPSGVGIGARWSEAAAATARRTRRRRARSRTRSSRPTCCRRTRQHQHLAGCIRARCEDGQLRAGAQVLEEQRLQHRNRRQAHRRVCRGLRREHLPPDVEDGVHPPGAHVSLDRQDHLPERALRPEPGDRGLQVDDRAEGERDRDLPRLRRRDDPGVPAGDEGRHPGVDLRLGLRDRPRQNYTTVVGEDTCKLGQAFANVMNTKVKSGNIAFMGGFPGNPLSAGWQTLRAEGAQPARSTSSRTTRRTGIRRRSRASSPESSRRPRTSPA